MTEELMLEKTKVYIKMIKQLEEQLPPDKIKWLNSIYGLNLSVNKDN